MRRRRGRWSADPMVCYKVYIGWLGLAQFAALGRPVNHHRNRHHRGTAKEHRMIRGPRLRIVRRLGTQLHGLTRKQPQENAYPPGQHGPDGVRRRKSQYRLQLEEKQKVRAYYGVTETQLRRTLTAAAGRSGVAGEMMLAALERRLDNVVFRLGLAPTIPAARQLVVHGHVQANGRRVDRPAYITSPGERIAIDPSMRASVVVLGALERGPAVHLPSYLERASDDVFAGNVIGLPARTDIPLQVNEAAVVEFYAR